jgi:hypothetical protein
MCIVAHSTKHFLNSPNRAINWKGYISSLAWSMTCAAQGMMYS